MKKDNLEEFVKANRAEFNDKTPGLAVWKNIRFRLNLGSTRSNSAIWKVAAIGFFLATTALLVDKYGGVESSSNVQFASSDSFTNVESFYLDVIDQKRTLITDLSQNIVMGDQAERDLYRLSAMYEVLKEEYECNPTEKVAEALVLNLIVRIDILNDEVQLAEQESDPNLTI